MRFGLNEGVGRRTTFRPPRRAARDHEEVGRCRPELETAVAAQARQQQAGAASEGCLSRQRRQAGTLTVKSGDVGTGVLETRAGDGFVDR